MMGNRFLAVMCAALVVLSVGGCGGGSSSPNEAPFGRGSNGKPYGGASHCLGCHAGFSWSRDVAYFTASRHVIHSREINAQDDSSCLECHAPVPDSVTLESVIAPEHVPAQGLAAVTCEVCHGAGGGEHSPTAEPVKPMADDSTCTDKCHIDGKTEQYPELAEGPPGTCVPGGGAYDAGQVIYDSHFKAAAGDWSGSGGMNVNDIAGFVTDGIGGKVCLSCHNPHMADATINRQWNASKHADKTAEGAWAHYNWTEDGVATSSNRSSCQQCKTTSGIIAKVDAARRGIEYVAPLSYQESFKPEMLLCYGCHADTRGTVRNPGPVEADYTDASGENVVFGDVGPSNICIECHAGRSNGQAIALADFATEIQGRNFGGFNSHYLAAAGIVFRTVGYEYPGQSYEDPTFYRHNGIGTPATLSGNNPVDTGSGGPCAGCHMQSQGSFPNHRFSPLLMSNYEDPDAEPSDLSPFCGKCHNITDPEGQRYFSFEELEHEEESFEEALDVLAHQLASFTPPIYFGDGYPYFFSDPDNQTNDTRFTAWPDKGTIGAAFNLNVLHHEPGAFAHNRFYTKRLIFDSVDFLDNGVMDGAITVDAVAYPLAAVWLDGDDEVDGVQRP